jgi:hypothetical protein
MARNVQSKVAIRAIQDGKLKSIVKEKEPSQER